jgi:hypothetical protein
MEKNAHVPRVPQNLMPMLADRDEMPERMAHWRISVRTLPTSSWIT